MNLILIESSELSDDGEAVLVGDRAAHLHRVLGVVPGDEVRVGLVEGPLGVATVIEHDGRSVRLRCRLGDERPETPDVDLLLALPRPKVLQRLWAQLAALGVGRIVLTNAFRVERHYFDTHVLEPATYRPLLIEGLQQARDTRVPAVSVHKRFRVLVEDELDTLCPDTERLVADPSAEQPVSVRVAAQSRRRVLVAVGPEGGWNEFERRLLESRGFRPVSMGPRTLRSDTACVALLALVHASCRAAALEAQ